MSTSVIDSLYGDSLRHSKFLITVNGVLSFTYTSSNPMLPSEVRDTFASEFPPGRTLIAPSSLNLSNGFKVEALTYLYETPAEFEVRPIS